MESSVANNVLEYENIEEFENKHNGLTPLNIEEC